MTLNLSLLLGGAGNPVAETYKTIQELWKDANPRNIRFNKYNPISAISAAKPQIFHLK